MQNLYLVIILFFTSIVTKVKKIKIIAEIGSTHDGNLDLAIKSINSAAIYGADIIKFQMHISEEETLRDAPNPPYFKSENRYDYFKRTSFTFSQWQKIKASCRSKNVEFMCSPFSIAAVNLLEKLKVKYYKVASGELTNLPLLEAINKTKKYTFLSTGMSNYKEIESALKVFKHSKICLMQCTSKYPCDDRSIGLNVIQEFKKKFKNIDIGFSDHTTDNIAAISAANLGVSAVEKHFTLSKKLYGSDAKFAMEPINFKDYCKSIKRVWIIHNSKVNKNSLSKLKNMKKIFEKSIVLGKNVKKGEIIKFDDLKFLKPGDGLRAYNYLKVVVLKAKKNLKKYNKIKLEDLKK